MTLQLKIVVWCVGSVVAGITAFALMRSGRPASLPDHTAADLSPALPPGAAPPLTQEPKQREEPRKARNMREEFKQASDYAKLADSLRDDAEAGHIDAQYYLSKTLRYCKENLGRFFVVPNKPPRTIEEAQGHWANRPAWYQQEIVDIYEHCRGFLEDPTHAGLLPEADSWLQKAVDGGYPLAEVVKATLQSDRALVLSVSPVASAQKNAASTSEQTQGLVMEALRQNTDPEVLFRMSDFVAASGDQGEASVVRYAWMLLACDRGYDCSAQADWVQNLCHQDPRCSEGETGENYLTRNLGADVDEARRLASTIGTAIDAQDWDVVPSYLWAMGQSTNNKN